MTDADWVALANRILGQIRLWEGSPVWKLVAALTVQNPRARVVGNSARGQRAGQRKAAAFCGTDMMRGVPRATGDPVPAWI